MITIMSEPEPRKRRHLSLLEVAIVLVVIAALSLFAIPQIQSRRILANEQQARTVLRQIHDAQRQFRDVNHGETYGFLPELLGEERRTDIRVKPRVLAATGLRPSGFAHVKDGYHFSVVLPGRGVPGVTQEDYANADFEKLDEGFLAYAWPVMAGYSGRLVYVIDASGELRQYRNDRDPPYSGLAAPPPANIGARRGDAFGGPPPGSSAIKFEPSAN